MKRRFLSAEYLELRAMLSASLPVAPAAEVMQLADLNAVPSAAEVANQQVPEQIANLKGDFNGDNVVDDVDIDMLCAAMANRIDTDYDLTQDGFVNKNDMDMLIHDIIGTEYGDADLDGTVSIGDLRFIFSNLFTGSSGWAAGDFSCDGIVDGRDFIEWNMHKFVQTPLGTRLSLAQSDVDVVSNMSVATSPATQLSSSHVDSKADESASVAPVDSQPAAAIQPVSESAKEVMTETAKPKSMGHAEIAAPVAQSETVVLSVVQSSPESNVGHGIRATRSVSQLAKHEQTARDRYFELRN